MPTPFSVFPIRNDADLERAFAVIDRVIDSEEGTPEADLLEVVSVLVEAYEKEHYPIDPPDPISAIKFRMEQGEHTTADLARLLGGRSHANEVLNGKRELSKRMIARLHREWEIPLESLITLDS